MYQNHDSTTLLPCRVFKAHKDYLTRLLLSPDIKLLATCSADHTVRIWKIDMNEDNLEIVPDSQSTSSIRNANNNSSSNPKDPNSTPNQALISHSQPRQPLNGSLSSHPATNANSNGSTPNPETFTPSHSNSSLTHPSSSSSAHSFSAISEIIEKRRPLPCDTVLDNHQRWVWDCAFSADSAYLVTVCSDHYARLWELSTASIIRQYNGHHRGAVCVALNDYSNPP
jgi:G protein beta subunit-like protein